MSPSRPGQFGGRQPSRPEHRYSRRAADSYDDILSAFTARVTTDEAMDEHDLAADGASYAGRSIG